MIIVFILGILFGFSLCCLFSYVAVKNRDDEIKLLNKKIEKYESLYCYDDGFIRKIGEDDGYKEN